MVYISSGRCHSDIMDKRKGIRDDEERGVGEKKRKTAKRLIEYQNATRLKFWCGKRERRM